MKSTKNRLVYHLHDVALKRAAERCIRGRLLDIGCGPKPYESMMAPLCTEHIGVDHAGTVHASARPELLGDAYNIPCPDGAFDSALCTAVLEHLEEPEQALRECFRALRSGGQAVYTVPFIWHLHEEPRDFYRFSKHGLRYLFDKVGFVDIDIEPLSGFWATFGQLFVYNLDRLNRGLLKRTHLMDAAELGVQAIAYGLDRWDRTEQWTWMYLVTAKKP